jgi:acyl carrier protein
MDMPQVLDRSEIVAMVIASLQEVLAQADEPPLGPVDEDIHLIGRRAVLDSLGMVTLIVDLEQRLEEEHGLSLTLADDRAMSQKNSPFLTVRSLADYIYALVEEEQRNGRA